MHLVITLPHPPKVLMPNTPTVWQAKLRPKKQAREAAMLAAERALRSNRDILVGLVPVGYTLRWHYRRGVGPDADNALAACKAYLDGIAQVLGVNDRNLECRGISRVKGTTALVDIDIHYEKGKMEQKQLNLFDLL